MDQPVQSDFQQLMQRVFSGSQDAAQELFDRYNTAVRRVVSARLQQPHRRVFDSNDVAQSVWASFFHLPADRYSFETPGDLVAFLSKVACRKLIDKTRRSPKSNDPDRAAEVPFDDLEDNEEGVRANDIPSPTPTPSKYMMADERWQKLTANLDKGQVRILEMLAQGYSHNAIAEHLGYDRKVVQRLIDRLEDLLRQP